MKVYENPIVFEVFNPNPVVSTQCYDKPFVLNGEAHVRKYRVRIELMPESRAAIGKRIQKMYDESTNMHDYLPLREEAEKIGYTIKRKPVKV